MSTRKKRVGRPPADPRGSRVIVLSVKVSAPELKRLKREARRRNMTVSALIMEPWRKSP